MTVRLQQPHRRRRQLGASAVAKARPDGATFLFTNTGHAANRALYARLDYDPAKDLTPVTVVAESPMAPLAQSGQARALAVSSAQRSAVMPDVPTVAEAGFPEATFSVWQAVLAPAGTPAPILDRLQQEIAAILAEGSLRTRLAELGPPPWHGALLRHLSQLA